MTVDPEGGIPGSFDPHIAQEGKVQLPDKLLPHVGRPECEKVRENPITASRKLPSACRNGSSASSPHRPSQPLTDLLPRVTWMAIGTKD